MNNNCTQEFMDQMVAQHQIDQQSFDSLVAAYFQNNPIMPIPLSANQINILIDQLACNQECIVFRAIDDITDTTLSWQIHPLSTRLDSNNKFINTAQQGEIETTFAVSLFKALIHIHTNNSTFEFIKSKPNYGNRLLIKASLQGQVVGLYNFTDDGPTKQ